MRKQMKQEFYFVIDDKMGYPEFPYNPSEIYPEFKDYMEIDKNNNLNYVYEYIRNLFIQAKYDINNIHTNNWNPFRGMIQDGQSVVIKPNFVIEKKNDDDPECITTHISLLRPLIDFLILLKRQDKINFTITICDVPLQSTNIEKLLDQNKLLYLLDYYKNRYNEEITFLDLRKETTLSDKDNFIKERIILSGDPLGYSEVKVFDSFLDPIIDDHNKFSVSNYDDKMTSNKHSSLHENYYLIPNTILKSDLFINVPKVKTHQKAGITIAMKNLIGINGDKSYIPHYRKGSPKHGGDEYSDKNDMAKSINSKLNRIIQERSKFAWKLFKKFKRIFKKKHELGVNGVCNGAWYGNDTLWRPILDLNNLLINVDQKGNLTGSPKRKYLCLSDGVISGEGNGPLSPNPKNTGIISLSENPVINDVILSKIMGFDWKMIPQLKNSVNLEDIFGFDGNFRKIIIEGDVENKGFQKYNFDKLPDINFKPAPGWIGHIK